jgi:hypothetical protein
VSEGDVLAMVKHELTSTYFCFDGQFYEQTPGVATGSPLSTVIVNFFMEDSEKKALEQAARLINFRRRRITQKKAYNIQKTAKV